MYCKNCGKPLSAEDKFCSQCGRKVEEEFVPAFRQHSPEASEPSAPERPKRKNFHIENFQWDLDGYPTDSRKTEDVAFNWDSVLEDKQRRIFESTLREREQQEAQEPVQTEASGEQEQTEEVVSEEELFADMGSLPVTEPTDVYQRGNAKIDKFYTYNQKNEKLQAMLDQEYERIRSGKTAAEPEAFAEDRTQASSIDKRRNTVHEEFDWTLSPLPETPQEQESQAEPQVRTTEVKALQYVGVALAQTPAGYLAKAQEEPAETPQSEATEALQAEPEMTASVQAGAAEQQAQEAGEATEPAEVPQTEPEKPAEAAEPAETTEDAASAEPQTDGSCPPSEKKKETEPGEKGSSGENNKLTFDDVFGDDDDDLDERPKKKGKVLKVIAILLCILVVLELAMIGIQYFAPDSAAAQAINHGYAKVARIFGASEEEVAVEPQESEMTRLITAQIDKNKNIGLVEEDTALRFEPEKTYDFDDFDKAYAFENQPWYNGDDGHPVTYGDEVIGTIIQYYSAWVDKMNRGDDEMLKYVDVTADFYQEAEALTAEEGKAYGLKRLAIGEMKSDGSGFYVMTETTAVDSKSKEEDVSRQVVYLEPDNKSMKIVRINQI